MTMTAVARIAVETWGIAKNPRLMESLGARCNTRIHSKGNGNSDGDSLSDVDDDTDEEEGEGGRQYGDTGACGYNRPCAHQICMSISVMHGF